jgi:hypothetical protein
MMLWPQEIQQMHREKLAAYGEPVTTATRLDALMNWGFKKLGLQRGWVGYPF